jgi:hypothetical protein
MHGHLRTPTRLPALVLDTELPLPASMEKYVANHLSHFVICLGNRVLSYELQLQHYVLIFFIKYT